MLEFDPTITWGNIGSTVIIMVTTCLYLNQRVVRPIREAIDAGQKATRANVEARDILQERLDDLEHKIQDIRAAQDAQRTMCNRWHPEDGG